MQLSDIESRILFVQTQLTRATDQFDQAIQQDLELGELKKIFHEMKKFRLLLDEAVMEKKDTKTT